MVEWGSQWQHYQCINHFIKKEKITMQCCGGTESLRSAGCAQEHFELLGNILDPKYTQFMCILQFSANLQIFTSAKQKKLTSFEKFTGSINMAIKYLFVGQMFNKTSIVYNEKIK